MQSTEPPVTVTQAFNCPVEKLWSVITNVEEMRQWYFENIPDFKAELGFETKFVVDAGERQFTHLWKITEVDVNKRLVYDWSYPEYPGDAYVVFALTELDSGSQLTVTFYVREDFPDEIPEFRRESCVGGWAYFINEQLKAYLSS